MDDATYHVLMLMMIVIGWTSPLAAIIYCAWLRSKAPNPRAKLVLGSLALIANFLLARETWSATFDGAKTGLFCHIVFAVFGLLVILDVFIKSANRRDVEQT